MSVPVGRFSVWHKEFALMTERSRAVPAMRPPRASSCSVMTRPKPLLTPVMSQFLLGMCRFSLRL
jgi:hypothetical protein